MLFSPDSFKIRSGNEKLTFKREIHLLFKNYLLVPVLELIATTNLFTQRLLSLVTHILHDLQQSKPARQTPIKHVRTLLQHFKLHLKMLSKDYLLFLKR